MTFYTQIHQLYSRSRAYLLLAAYLCLVATTFASPLSISATDIGFFSTAALCIISGEFFYQFKRVYTNPITLSILLLLAFVFVGMFWSVATWHDRWTALHKYQKLLYFILLLPLCLSQPWRERAISAFLLAITITVILSSILMYTPLHLGNDFSAQFVFHSRIETSYFVAFSTYILVHRALHSPRYRWLYWLLAIIFTFHEFFINDGRTGWVVYFGLVVLFFMQRAVSSQDNHAQKIRYVRIALRGMLLGTITILVLATIIYHLSTSFHDRISLLTHDLLRSHAQQTDVSKKYQPDLRISFFKHSLLLIKEHPAMGIGTASFQAVYKQSPFVPSWHTLNNPHNEYLLIMVQGGMVGLGLLLYFFGAQWWVSFRLRNEREIAQAFIVSGMISCCFNAFLYTTTTGHFYVLFSSLLLSQYLPSTPIKRKAILNPCSLDRSDEEAQKLLAKYKKCEYLADKEKL